MGEFDWCGKRFVVNQQKYEAIVQIAEKREFEEFGKQVLVTGIRNLRCGFRAAVFNVFSTQPRGCASTFTP